MDLVLIGAFLAVLSSGFSALRFYFARKTVSPRSPYRVTIVSSLVGVLFFVPASLILNYPDFRLSWVGFFIFVVVGLLIAFALILMYESVRRVGASRTSPIIRGNMLIASLIAVLFLGETVETLHLIGIVILFFGVALVSYETSGGESDSESLFSLNLAFPLTAMILVGFTSISVSLGYAEGVPVTIGLAVQLLTSFIVILSIFLYSGRHPLKPFRVEEKNLYIWAGISYVTFLACWNIALSIAPVVVVIPLTGMTPLFVLLLSYFYLKQLEKITKILVFGVLLTVLGAALVGIFM
ncbi:hypothetical protein AKJ56_01465 [candidate division MSBL1 archaeon SCGC-AAA382N08]|uniref:EamA domain-containing protein n=1 Tax=candidate division MSBL1 archaeon SCGC-AAA382N08 TaxID=1698285 RepID=A0A133VPK7_9EURY|nr:hypothetical protein AKJ56_01465 [candidate division MSBL1 archaeon SCGC-AAA382N08]